MMNAFVKYTFSSIKTFESRLHSTPSSLFLCYSCCFPSFPSPVQKYIYPWNSELKNNVFHEKETCYSTVYSQ
jgi:hypothetical protein